MCVCRCSGNRRKYIEKPVPVYIYVHRCLLQDCSENYHMLRHKSHWFLEIWFLRNSTLNGHIVQRLSSRLHLPSLGLALCWYAMSCLPSAHPNDDLQEKWGLVTAGESASKCAWPYALREPATSIENLKESEMVSCIFYLFGFFSVENHCLYSEILFNMKYFRLTCRFYDFKSFCLCRKLDVSWVFLQQRRVNLA